MQKINVCTDLGAVPVHGTEVTAEGKGIGSERKGEIEIENNSDSGNTVESEEISIIEEEGEEDSDDDEDYDGFDSLNSRDVSLTSENGQTDTTNSSCSSRNGLTLKEQEVSEMLLLSQSVNTQTLLLYWTVLCVHVQSLPACTFMFYVCLCVMSLSISMSPYLFIVSHYFLHHYFRLPISSRHAAV